MTFIINEIPEELAGKMQSAGVWQPDCPVAINQLRLLDIAHYDFKGNVGQGQLVVLGLMAENYLNIFKELFRLQFPINKIKTIEHYQGDDFASMEDNNSSCFNYRKITGTNTLSVHSYGLAIDINPLQNPMIDIDDNTKSIRVYPQEGVNFLNRRNQRPGMLEPVVSVFKDNRLDVWGGNWNNPIDYHHFQVERALAENLICQK